MKKKLIGVLVFLIAMVGGLYFMGVFEGGQTTKEDHEQEETTNVEVDKVQTQERIEKTMPDFDDTTELELDLEFNEDNPASML